MNEILAAARRYPASRIYIAAYADPQESQTGGQNAKTLSEQLVIDSARYLASRGIEPERISGKGMGANPDVGRAVVVSVDVAGASSVPGPSARLLAEREAGAVEPERYPQQNLTFKDSAGASAYRIGRGDEIKITIWYTTGPQEFTVPVSDQGTVTFDLIQEAPILGLTMQEAQSLFVNLLKRYVRNPRVGVVVTRYASRSVTVVGPEGPQLFPLIGRTTVLDLLAREKAVPAAADLKGIRVTRGRQEFKVNLFRTILDQDWKQNLVLDDGDIIYLPTFTESGNYVVVLGAVENPGIYAVRTRMTAMEAVFIAGGSVEGAYLPHARIIRGDLKNPKILPANIDLVLQQGNPRAQVELESGDVLYVPRTRISNWNQFLSDVRPTLEVLSLPFRGLGAALFFDRTGTGTQQTTTIIVLPTPIVPLP